MAEHTTISWCDATWNPFIGCTKVSPGCSHCYMMRYMKRYGRDGTTVVRASKPTFTLPIRRHRDGSPLIPPGALVFTCSLSDWFHEAADGWRDEAWALIRQRPDCLFLILTKRADRIADHLPADWGEGYPNVAIGVTAENQEWADKRIPYLLRAPARFRFVSIEPMVGAIGDHWFLEPSYRCSECGATGGNDSQAFEFCAEETIRPGGIDWVIVGGESGPDSRPMHEAWVRELRDACARSNVLFHLKQWGEWIPETQIVEGMPLPRDRRVAVLGIGERMVHLGVDNTGAALDGQTHRDRLPWPGGGAA